VRRHGKMKSWQLIFSALLLVGCAPVISKELRGQVAKELTFQEVRKDPEAYVGKIILWSGVIVKSINLKEGTLIEVLQKPADRRGRPRDVDESEGRFLALYSGYLDVAIYSQGKEVTIAGEIKGKKVLPLGEIEYSYPLVSIKEIHLWRPVREERVYPYLYWRYPWWWYYPYWDWHLWVGGTIYF